MQPLTGWGEVATFDPVSGVLRNGAAPDVQPQGVYAGFGGRMAVFFRGRDGLALRIANAMIPLEAPGVAIAWELTAPGVARFQVLSPRGLELDVAYPVVDPRADLGRTIRDVLSDPARRATTFRPEPGRR